MGFMDAEITDKQWWVQIDGNNGIESFPADLIDIDAIRAILEGEEDEDFGDKILAICRDYCETDRVHSAELVHGYGVRSSASGYMDCTPWTVYTNKREAERAARQEQRECDGLD